MSEPTPTPRQPRPGDPFAGPRPVEAQVETDGKKKPKVKRKKGRRFFLILLMVSGMLMLATFMFFANSKSIITDFYAEVVIPRSIPEGLPAGYPIEKARQVVETLQDYFALVDDGQIDDETALEMMSQIETVLQDRIVTDAEVEQLLTAAKTLRPAKAR